MKDKALTPDDFPAHHAEWAHRDHLLIAWGLLHGGMVVDLPRSELSLSRESPAFIAFTLDDFGLPILTPELRKRLGDEWRKWRDAR